MSAQLKSEILSTFDQIKIENRIECKAEVVLNHHKSGKGLSFISKVTKLTINEVLKILKQAG